MENFVAGASAGLMVDVVLLPIDTIKTRLQTRKGFRQSGGFTRLFSGLGPAAACSVPSGATFFYIYESAKQCPCGWLYASTVAEAGACLVRVPCDNVKQRLQAVPGSTASSTVKSLAASGGVAAFYRGYTATLIRDVPFAGIQFGIIESLKMTFGLEPWKCGFYGSLGGAVAGFLTTPIDVVKTRIMLSETGRSSVPLAIAALFAEEGLKGLFRGSSARVAFLTVGGFVFIGSYEATKTVLKW